MTLTINGNPCQFARQIDPVAAPVTGATIAFLDKQFAPEPAKSGRPGGRRMTRDLALCQQVASNDIAIRALDLEVMAPAPEVSQVHHFGDATPDHELKLE